METEQEMAGVMEETEEVVQEKEIEKTEVEKSLQQEEIKRLSLMTTLEGSN